jgi:hypothetical protein
LVLIVAGPGNDGYVKEHGPNHRFGQGSSASPELPG